MLLLFNRINSFLTTKRMSYSLFYHSCMCNLYRDTYCTRCRDKYRIVKLRIIPALIPMINISFMNADLIISFFYVYCYIFINLLEYLCRIVFLKWKEYGQTRSRSYHTI